VRKVVPVIIEKRSDVMKLKEELQGVCYDLEYSVDAVKSIDAAEEPLVNIQELLKNAIFLKQQLKYEETRRKKDSSSNKDSVYKRFSAHIPLEFPDITGAMRETTNRVENIIGMNAATEGIQRSHTTLH
jgi:BLOC-1 related complex subunit 8